MNDRLEQPQKQLIMSAELAVNLRLKGNGKFWRQHNAESLLHCRCQWLAGGWDALVDEILTHRIYPNSI